MSISNLSLAKELIYHKCDFDFSALKFEKESIEYDSCTFKLNGKSVIHRSAKITPLKIGQFVTVWKRNESGQTAPFHSGDDFDLVIISTRNVNLFGQFIFPKSILIERGIITTDLKQGKRGIRVYPTWDVTMNKQAQKTQKWQSAYFIESSEFSIERVKQLCL
ncbi:MepB family protein [Pedobacter sp. Du54]|uniref:MepB family protein n=1 Tax=Pedobacter anseongensis TaxID=3133439 RepID=UPI0030B2EF56